MTIPFTVIGGFLGAGKTTLLNRLLAQAEGRRFAVLVNDFGALDIDGRLVKQHGGDTIALANGCLCCTIGDSLVQTLMSLLDRGAEVDHIVVEASGVADPGRIADLGVLDSRLQRDGVVVVVDAADVRERAADRRLSDTVLRQLSSADLLVLNKIDLVQDVATLRAWMAGQSSAPVLEAVQANVPVDLLFGLERHGTAGKGATADAFRSWSYSWIAPLDRQAVLALLSDADPIRAKGIVRFADSPDRRTILHRVGRRLDLSDGGTWADDEESRLVLLGLAPRLAFTSAA